MSERGKSEHRSESTFRRALDTSPGYMVAYLCN
jgi:hypothetical protein